MGGVVQGRTLDFRSSCLGFKSPRLHVISFFSEPFKPFDWFFEFLLFECDKLLPFYSGIFIYLYPYTYYYRYILEGIAPLKAIPSRAEALPMSDVTPVRDRIEEEIYKSFDSLSLKALKFSELLKTLDLSPISEQVETEYKNVWHTQHDPSAIAKAAVYKELIGIKSADTLAKYLKRYPEEAIALGFKEGEITGHRTLNRCITGKVEELAKWAAWKIREAAEEYGVRLIDPRDFGGEKKLKREEIKKICKLAGKHIFPLIDISSEYHNSKYSNEDMLNLLLHAAFTGDFAENASKTLKKAIQTGMFPMRTLYSIT